MRSTAALFPFDSHLLPAVKLFEELQDKYTLRALISPSGYGLTGRDAGYSRNHPPVGLTVNDALDPTDPTWDTLILSQPHRTEAMANAELESVAERAVQLGKSVLYFDYGSTNVFEELLSLSEHHPGKFEFYGKTPHTPAIPAFNVEKYKYIDTPVVLIGGLVAEADTFEVLLRLTARLRADGWCVTGITRHPLGKHFGLHTVNHIFDSKSMTGEAKILELNRFVRSLEAAERPNVILMEAPDAVLKYNNYAPNGFGIQTYMLCQAVRPDYFVCCVPCELAQGLFLETISRDFEYRLGSSIHAAHVSNLVVDSMDVAQTNSISYTHVDLAEVRAQITKHGESSPIPLFDVVSNGVDRLSAHLCDVISGGSNG
jgi:peptide maturation system protein (TIGR04066 family)